MDAGLRFVPSVHGRVFLDCGNGAGSWISPTLLRRAGATVDELFCQPDGRFPNRPSEPDQHNLGALSQTCRKHARWGIAHDGDADRMVAVQPTGQLLAPEAVIVALALMRRAKTIATPVDA